jgi:hypothetical protein
VYTAPVADAYGGARHQDHKPADRQYLPPGAAGIVAIDERAKTNTSTPRSPPR